MPSLETIAAPLAVMVHAEQAQYIGRRLVDKLSDTIPRQLFDIAVQAKSLGKVRHSCCLCLALPCVRCD